MLATLFLAACGPSSLRLGVDDTGDTHPVEDIGGFPDDSGEDSGEETGEPAPVDLFDTSFVHTLDLYLSDEAVRELNGRRGDDIYQTGSIVIDGERVDDVGVRLKGSYSYRTLDAKAAFKIDLNHYVEGQDYGGLSKLTVNNMLNDETQLHEMLAYTTFSRLGLLSARVSYAWVRVNEDDYGLYALIETEGTTDWMQQWTGNRDGRVYEGGYPFYPESWAHADFTTQEAPSFELEAGVDIQSADVLAASELNMNSDDWYVGVDAAIEMQQYLAFTAAEIWTSQWDGYNFNVNNYRVYVSPDDGRARFLPSGMDWSFVDYLDLRAAGSAVGSRCYADAACWSALLTEIDATCDAADSAELLALFDEQQALIDAFVDDDPRKELTTANIHAAQYTMRAWIEGRSGAVRTQFGI